MGTSKSLSSGSGGAWSPLKRKITRHFSGSRPATARGIVGSTVRAAGGIGVGGRGGGRGGGGASVGRVVGGLGGFGTFVRDLGLAGALKFLELAELEGKSAAEVAATISEHLADAVDGVDGDLMRDALRNAIIEAAALGDADGFADLERGLQSFIEREGITGLVEVFLSKFVFDAVWVNIEAYVQSNAQDQNAYDAFMHAVESVCGAEVRGAIDDARTQGQFDSLDWFGEDGLQIGHSIFESINSRLRGMDNE